MPEKILVKKKFKQQLKLNISPTNLTTQGEVEVDLKKNILGRHSTKTKAKET